MLEIPAAPAVLELGVERRWDGTELRAPGPGARVLLSATSDALLIEAGMLHSRAPRIPDAPRGARVEGLWHFDVVECFVAGADGRYLEVELGAGGHYLALAFAAPRRRADDFAHAALEVRWESGATGWTSRCRIPRSWMFEPVARVNAFAIASGEFLAHHPVGGAQPDFHRPEAFPRARIPSWEASRRADQRAKRA